MTALLTEWHAFTHALHVALPSAVAVTAGAGLWCWVMGGRRA